MLSHLHPGVTIDGNDITVELKKALPPTLYAGQRWIWDHAQNRAERSLGREAANKEVAAAFTSPETTAREAINALGRHPPSDWPTPRDVAPAPWPVRQLWSAASESLHAALPPALAAVHAFLWRSAAIRAEKRRARCECLSCPDVWASMTGHEAAAIDALVALVLDPPEDWPQPAEVPAEPAGALLMRVIRADVASRAAADESR